MAGLDLLAEAPEHADRVTEVLKGFRYEPHPAPKHARDVDDYGTLIKQAVKDKDTDVLIVHIVGHGQLAEGRSETLYILDHDGNLLDDPVSAWIRLIEDHHEHQHRPLTLFILDVCYAGEAAVHAWHSRMDVARRHAWVLAATDFRGKAYGYRLSRALTKVLKSYQDRHRRFDPSIRYIPPSTVWQDIERTVNGMAAEDQGLGQRILSSLVPLHTDLSHLPFFPNPSYGSSSSPPSLPSEITQDINPEIDPAHFILRAGGAEPVQRSWDEGYFCGRKEELEDLSGWLDSDDTEQRVRVVTGKPGAGKSALLGILMCAAHPGLRAKTRTLWLPLETLAPGENDRIAMVHAHGLELQQITDVLTGQLTNMVADTEEDDSQESKRVFRPVNEPRRPTKSVLDSLPDDDRVVTVVIDALDEAKDPGKVVTDLLIPLSEHTQDARQRTRLLIGTRREEQFLDLLELARYDDGLTDLDEASPASVRQALGGYLTRLLQARSTPYGKANMSRVREKLVQVVAERLVPYRTNISAQESESDEALEYGEFLVAGLFAHQLLTDEEPCLTLEEAETLGRTVPRDLPSLLELDLKRHSDQPLLQPMLTALAFAQGQGMPEDVLSYATAAFSATANGPVSLTELQALLDYEARFYLRREVNEDGSTLYRLFHEVLADWLRHSAGHPSERPGP